MAALELLATVPAEDYLEGEKGSTGKHEYVHGRVLALAGTSDTHNRIRVNLTVGLDAASTKEGRQLFVADLKLSIFGERCYHPDLMARGLRSFPTPLKAGSRSAGKGVVRYCWLAWTPRSTLTPATGG